MIPCPILTKIFGIEVIPPSKPFFRPAKIFLPTSVKSIFLRFSIASCTFGIPRNASIKSLIAPITILTPEASLSKPLVIKSLLNKKSLNFTSKSPIPAVKSKTLMSKASSIAAKTLKANFNPPPTIVDTMSNNANKPLNVRFNLSASSYDILIQVVAL